MNNVSQNQSTVVPANNAASQQQPGLVGALTPIILMVLVFYFLIIRPQQKKETKRRSLVNSVKKGDKVVTSCGIIGVLHKIIGEKEVSVEISDGVRIRMLKDSIAEVLGKDSGLGKDDVEESINKVTEKGKGKKASKK
ncbi:MAG: preprotein translocase subunit YajC [Holosporaceae bacterium]|jgi:preprotein translocase subunit YajC|nr:preprotein translocase subunit YajC [Holosporaceae bacterium]